MSLLAPLYLLGLLGLLVPWLLHRFSHHTPTEQAFPSTRFLEPTKPPTTNKRKLRYWLLLLLRALFIAMLCLLFAQPWWADDDENIQTDKVELVVLDTSFSMRADTNWSNATSALQDYLKALPTSTGVQLFSFSKQLQKQTGITHDRQVVLGAAAKLEPNYYSADFGELMRSLNKAANEIELPVSATFITDAQRANLPQKKNTLLANGLDAFNVIPITEINPVNYSLQAQARTSDEVKARVSVSVFASDASDANLSNVKSKTVLLELNDEIIDSETIAISAGEQLTLQFDDISIPTDIEQLLSVRFADSDKLPDDDGVRIPIVGLSTMNVTMTHLGRKPSEQAQVFVGTALETNNDVKVESLSLNAALAPHVRHAVVFTDDIKTTPGVVSQFVMNGGNVLLLPSATDLSADVLSNAASTVASVDSAHSLRLGDIDWFDSGFYSTTSLSLKETEITLLGLSTGEPLLIERNIIGGGRLLVLNDALDGVGSDFPLQPSFVLMLQSIVNYFNASNALPTELEVGKALFIPSNTQVLSPSGNSLLELNELTQTNTLNLDTPGVYSVLGVDSVQKVTAILNPVESNAVAMSQADIEAWESRHSVNENVDQQKTSAVNTAWQQESHGNSLAVLRWLLPLLLILLFVESVYANRMLWVRRESA